MLKTLMASAHTSLTIALRKSPSYAESLIYPCFVYYGAFAQRLYRQERVLPKSAPFHANHAIYEEADMSKKAAMPDAQPVPILASHSLMGNVSKSPNIRR